MIEFAGSIGANLLPPGLSRDEDPIDVGFLVPSQGPDSALPAEFAPIDPVDIDLTGQVSGREFCLVAGFPVSRKWAKHTGKELTGARLNFVGITFEQDGYRERGYDPTTNILVEYHIKKAIYPEGDRANAPSPRGMSGGGIFRIGRDAKGNPDSSTAQLVGIMHTFSERSGLFVGTRIREVLRLFVSALPPQVTARGGASQEAPSK